MRKSFLSRRSLALAMLLPAALPTLAQADSLGAGVSTDYTAVINFDRTDYYVDGRYSTSTPTAALAPLQTSILFNPLVPDSSGNIVLPSNFADQVARMRAGSPNAGYTLGLGSLNAIAGNATATANFNTQLKSIASTYGFTGVDLDWEDMPGVVSATNYGTTVKSVATALHASNLVVSTSHATGTQYLPYVAQIAGAVDFLNLQFYYSTTGAMNMATFQATLSNYLAQGLQASQIRIGLASYGMVNPNATSTTDKWRSWTNLINAGVDVTNLNQWTDPKNGETYYFSGLNLIRDKVEYAMANGFAGVFSWELTQDKNYSNPLSVYALIDSLAISGTPTLELNDSNAGAGKLGTGVVNLGSGAVLNNGLLRFARTGTNTYANRIDGSGIVETTGTGTTILTGANTYSGGTHIVAGSTLQVGAGTAAGRLGTGAVLNDGTLVFNHSDTITVANAFAGAGSLTKTGTGKLTLTGASNSVGSVSVTGGTLENSGNLSIAANLLIGVAATGTFNQTAGTVTVASATGGFGAGLNIGHKVGGTGAYNLSGGTLNALNANATIGAGGGNTGTLAISGAGTANLRGLDLTTSTSAIANLNLTGGRLNLGAGGITAIAAGTRNLNLGAGTVGAFANWSSAEAFTLTHAATGTTFDTLDSANATTARTVTLSGALSGVGKLNKTGAGTLVLSGANTYTGGTAIAGGTLLANHATALGGPGAAVVVSGGVLQVGSGITLMNSASLALGSGATLKFTTSAESLATSGITLNGAGTYNLAAGSILDVGAFTTAGTYHLITGANGAGAALSGFTNTLGGYAYQLNALTGGVDLVVTSAVPEPSTYGLIGAGALAVTALVRRRRGRAAKSLRA